MINFVGLKDIINPNNIHIMHTKLVVAAILIPLLFSCNSKADREALKEELKAEMQAEQMEKENKELKAELEAAKSKAANAQAEASQAKAEAKVAKQKAAQPSQKTTTSVNMIRMRHIKIADLSGYTNLRNSPNGAVCMRLYANMDYDIYVNGISNGWYRIAEIYRPDGSQVRLHSSNTGWWIHQSICYTAN